MARTDLTVAQLVPNGVLAKPAGVVGTTDGHRVAGIKPEQLLLQVVVATAEIDLTIAAGVSPPALESQAQVHVLAIGTHYVGPFTSAEVAQADGSVWINYETPANATIAALRVPRAF